MMTKTKLDDMLADLKSSGDQATLSQERLTQMVDVALSFDQEKPSSAHIIAFPRRAFFGGGAAGALAAMLMVALNLPMNEQQISVQSSESKALYSQGVQSSSLDFEMESDDMVDLFILENLDA